MDSVIPKHRNFLKNTLFLIFPIALTILSSKVVNDKTNSPQFLYAIFLSNLSSLIYTCAYFAGNIPVSRWIQYHIPNNSYNELKYNQGYSSTYFGFPLLISNIISIIFSILFITKDDPTEDSTEDPTEDSTTIKNKQLFYWIIGINTVYITFIILNQSNWKNAFFTHSEGTSIIPPTGIPP